MWFHSTQSSELMARAREEENLLHGWLERGQERNSFKEDIWISWGDPVLRPNNSPKWGKVRRQMQRSMHEPFIVLYRSRVCVIIAVPETIHACWWSSYKQTPALLQLLCLSEEVTVYVVSFQVIILKNNLAPTVRDGFVVDFELSFQLGVTYGVRATRCVLEQTGCRLYCCLIKPMEGEKHKPVLYHGQHPAEEHGRVDMISFPEDRWGFQFVFWSRGSPASPCQIHQ